MRIYPELLVDQEFKTLGDQGFSGTLNDRQFAFLRSKGYVNALPDMMTSWLSYSPANLFALNEPGVWLDPSDVVNLDWRRNLLLQSNSFATSPWSGGGATIVQGASPPLGSEAAWTISDTSDSIRQEISQIITLTAGVYTLSWYVGKTVGVRSNYPALFALSGSNIAICTVDTTNGIATPWSAYTGLTIVSATTAVADAGNFWRVSMSFTATSASWDIRLTPAATTNPTQSTGAMSSVPTGSAVAFGAQLELGSVATDYQRISDVNTEVLERFPKTTMFQDRAGSTAVTTPGQSVGLRLDKSKGLVLGSELGSGAALDKRVATDGTVTRAGGVITFVGAASALSTAISQEITGLVVGNTYRFSGRMRRTSGATVVFPAIRTASGGGGSALATGPNIGADWTNFSFFWQATQTSAFFGYTSGNGQTIEVAEASHSVKELPGNHAVANSDAARGIYGIEPVGGRRNLLLNTTTMATQNVTVTAVAHTLSFTGTGTVTLSGTSTAGPLVGTGVNDRVSLTFTPTAGTLTLTVSGSVTLAQLQIGSAFDAYQRVGTTQYDVTEAGKQTLHYVQYDGSDDGYVTPTITPGIDKVQVFAGVRKLSDAARAMLVELGNNVAQSVRFEAPNTTGSVYYSFSSVGSSSGFAGDTNAARAAPNTSVLTGLGDISADRSTLRVNGSQAAQATTDQGTGNYLAYPLYIGRRGGTTLPFNGRDYGLVVRFGANLDASTIAATESYMAQKTGVTL